MQGASLFWGYKTFPKGIVKGDAGSPQVKGMQGASLFWGYKTFPKGIVKGDAGSPQVKGMQRVHKGDAGSPYLECSSTSSSSPSL